MSMNPAAVSLILRNLHTNYTDKKADGARRPLPRILSVELRHDFLLRYCFQRNRTAGCAEAELRAAAVIHRLVFVACDGEFACKLAADAAVAQPESLARPAAGA